MLLFIYGERQRHKIMPRTISCAGMDVSGDDPDLAITVLTCEGDLRDPAFPNRLTQIICKLKRLVSEDNKKPFQVTKVEPWNSVRVTFNIPRNAAQRLRQLAERGDNTLRELGILSVQIEGDQVITLTLTNSFNESREQLLIGKSSESVTNSVVASSLVNSSAININSSELTVNYNNVNSLTSSSVSSAVSSSVDLIGSPSSGSSVEITRKNIAQYLSQQHLDVVNSTSVPTSVESISDRLPAFRSPNVVAPINTEPIPFLNSSSTSTLTSQLLTCVTSGANTCTASSSAGSRLSAVTSIANSSLREIQSNYGLFPFASMQHSYQAMHTKQGLQGLNAAHFTSVQRPNQVITTPSVRLPLSFGSTQPSQSLPNSTAATVSSTISSITSSISNRLQSTTTRDANNVKVLSSQSQQPIPSLSQTPPHPAVAQVVSQSCNNPNSASANVALTSPLLVNLLQSDATSGHLKGPKAQTSSLNQINTSNDLTQKRKPRKSRKSKEKIEAEVTQSAYFGNTSAGAQTSTQSSHSNAQTSVATNSSTSPSLKHLPSNPLPQQSGMDSQMQTQSKFNISSHLISIPINAMPSFPSIHPEAQGQPQVVRAGHLPLRSQLSRPPISAPKVGSPAISTTHLRKPLFVTTSQTSSSKPYLTVNTANPHSKPLHEQKSSPNPNPNSANSKVDSSGADKNSETNAVFPSPPTARMSGKTKHLINPFTGLLEPMLSDEEEEDRPSPPTTLFPELDAGSDVGGNSERSLSDAGSNGKENNHSSDTDSGLGKSGTDVSSQSSIDVGNGDNTPTHLKDISSKACVSVTEGMSSGESAIDKLKLKLKIEAKTESPKADNFPMNTPFHSRSHFTKQKSSEPSNPLSNPCVAALPIDSIPVMMAEPRVPPLHISIRGPNSAVVVSNRRESTSELEMKTNVVKKGRAVRTTRAMSVESGLGTECTNLNKNQRKKLQREQRFLSGGGIVTSTLSVCASPSVESLVDINKTLNDSTFALSSGATSDPSEPVDTPPTPSSDVRSNCAQNQSIDSNDNNNNNNNNNNNVNNSKNISPNKCVPQLNNEDNSSQLCAIRTPDVSTDSSIKTSVLSINETIVNKINNDLQTINTRLPTPNSVSPNAAEDCDSIRDKSELNCATKSTALDRQAFELNALTRHSSNELTNSESAVSLSPIESHKIVLINDNEKSLDNLKTLKSRKLPVAAVVSVESLINVNSEPIVNKLSRIGRINCISTSIPALVNSREFNSVRNTSALHLTESKPTSSLNCLIDTTIESNETKDYIQTTSSITKINSFVPQIIDKSAKIVVISESKKQFNISNKSESKQQMTKSDVILNGDINSNKNERQNSSDFDKLNSIIETESKPHLTGHQLSDSSDPQNNIIVKSEENQMESNVKTVSESYESNKIDVLSEVPKQESNDKNASETVSKDNEMSINSNNCSILNQSISEITATSDNLVKTESKCSKSIEFVDLNTRIALELKTSDRKEKTSEESVSDIVNNCSDDKTNESSGETKTIEVNSVGSEETVRQPLQIVISTTVPSLTTTTSTPMFSQLKSSSFESGSRVTLITFKPSLNSPNTSSASGGRASDFSTSSLSSQMPGKGVPFKLLTIPSGSGGITVRSAANKLVELINSTASSPASPLSPNHMPSNGSPIPINATSPPMRLLVSKMATTGGVTQTGVPVSVAGNSIGQLVVVKSVVVTNPSPSIKLVPARNPSVNTASLLIPVTRTNSPIESLNSINNNNICEQMPKQLSHSLKPNNEIHNCVTNEDNDNSCSENEVQNQGSKAEVNNLPQMEPVDLTVQCPDSQTLSSNENIKTEDNESVPQIINSSVVSENEILSDEEVNDDNPLTHSVASDHNYIMKKSNEEFEDKETEESVLNLSNTTETDNFDALRDNDIMTDDEYKTPDFQSDHILEHRLKQSHDLQSRPNKRKSSENAAELIKACMGVDDTPKKNSSFNYCSSFSVPSGVSTRTRTSSLDNDCVITTTTIDSSEANHLNKSKNLRIRKSKVSSSEHNFTQDNCSSDDEIAIKDSSGLSWTTAKPRLRTGTSPKNQKISKQKNMNCIKDSNKEKIANRSNEKGKKGRDRDQSKTSSTQRSTRRSRDHNIMISTTTGINLHSSESSSEPLHMEIVGLELSNDSSTNNYITDPSTASTPSPIITSSLLVKRKTRVGLNNNNNNNTEQSESGLTKRRRIVKENHR